jgi:photosystem II stability/assembly factor-like uncharacterized protein
VQLIYRIAANAILLSFAASGPGPWNAEDSGTKSSLRGVHNVGQGVAWASGTKGVVLRSEDDGYLWQQCAIPAGAGELDFRGVWAWDANHAVALSSGPGSASGLYETTDGCAHWRLLFTNPDGAGFWDAVAFWNQQQGIVLGDPVKGRFVVYRTSDGGEHWSRDDSPGLNADARGEGVFAASNSALALSPGGADIYFGTGGPGGARIFHFHSGNQSNSGNWTSSKLPFAHGSDATGVFSLAFRDSRHAVAVGGDYKQPNERGGTAAWTSDGGLTWTAASGPPAGYRSAAGWSQKLHGWIAVGPTGSDISYDDGKTWKQFDKSNWNALSLPWAAGPQGKIAALNEAALSLHN